MRVGTVVRTDPLERLLTQSTPQTQNRWYVWFKFQISESFLKKDSTSQLTCLTCSDLQWLARLKCMTFAFLWYWEPYLCQKLLTKEASSNPYNASLTTLQICITIPCETQQFWVFVSLWQLWGCDSGGDLWLKAGQLQVLVATDVAARGLHVKHLLGNPGNINLTARDFRKTLRDWGLSRCMKSFL